MVGKAAGSEEFQKRPKHWPNMVRAALFRSLKYTQAEAAEAAGRSERTIRDWENSTLWPEALREAEDVYLVDLKHAAMRSVLKAAGRNADLGFKVLERLMPALAPKQKLEHTGKDGGPIRTEDVTLTDEERSARLVALLAQAQARKEADS